MTEEVTPRLTAGFIIQEVAKAYGVEARMLTSPRRHKEYVRPRQVAMWLTKQLIPAYSMPQIGRAFGNRDHTTVMHAHHRVETMSDHDPDFYATLIVLRDRIVEATTPAAADVATIEQEARQLARTLSKAAIAIARAHPALAIRAFGPIARRFGPNLPNKEIK